METSEKREKYIDVYGEPEMNGNLTSWLARSREELEVMIDMAGIQDSVDYVETAIDNKGVFIDSTKSIAITKIMKDMYCVISNTEIMNLMLYGWR